MPESGAHVVKKAGELYGDLLARSWQEALDKVGNRPGEQIDPLTAFSRYKAFPVKFGEQVLGHTYWAFQRYYLWALMKYHYVSVRSCRKSSKTFTSADAVAWKMSTAKTICVTTSSTATQVREILWGRLRTCFVEARSRLPGEMMTTSWRVGPDWYAIGLSVNRPENILGFHAGIDMADFEEKEDHSKDDWVEETGAASDLPEMAREARDRATYEGSDLMFLLDECPGIDASIIDNLQGSWNGPRVFVGMQGNPTMALDAKHEFAASHREKGRFHRIHIAACEFDPALDDCDSDRCFHGVPPKFCDPKWIDGRKAAWGEESALYRSHVLGLFCGQTSERAILPKRVLESALLAEFVDPGTAECRHMGVDIARQGGDESVATLWINGRLSAVHSWRTPDLMSTVGVVLQLMHSWAPEGGKFLAGNVHLDQTGLGAGVVDRLRQMGYYVDGVDFGSRPRNCWPRLNGQLQFTNMRTEMAWTLRRALEEGIAQIPRTYEEVWRESAWISYDFTERAAGTLIWVAESKDDLRERYGRSPDFLDAAMLGWVRGASAKGAIQIIKPTDLRSLKSRLRLGQQNGNGNGRHG